MKVIQILAIGSSLRKGSYNAQLLQIATQSLQEKIITPKQLNLTNHLANSDEQFKVQFSILPVDILKQIPLFDQDVESAGVPSAVQDLKKLIKESHGILLASPEYNYSVSGVTKNWIDWCSRGGNAFVDKPVGLLCAAAGMTAGFGNLANLKHIFNSVNARVLPLHYSIAKAYEYFDENGVKAERRKELESGSQTVVNTLLADIMMRNF